jgi:hypothetical protein
VTKAVLCSVLVAGLLVAPVFAQSPTGAWNGLPDRFQVDTGYFRINADTQLRYNAGGGGDVNFQKDLGLNQHANTFWVDSTWRGQVFLTFRF